MSRRGEPTERDAFVALWIEETAGAREQGSPVCEGRPFSRHHRLCDAVELMRLARRCDRYAVALCNREVSEREVRAHNRTVGALRELVAKYGFTASVSGDPRGYVVKVHFPSGAHNTWGCEEDGWGVPVA